MLAKPPALIYIFKSLPLPPSFRLKCVLPCPDPQAGCQSASEALGWYSKTGRSELSRGQKATPFTQKRYNKNIRQKSGQFDRF
jgi:hypothetical protein